MISGPLEPRHVGGLKNITHLGDPLAQQTKFNVEVRIILRLMNVAHDIIDYVHIHSF